MSVIDRNRFDLLVRGGTIVTPAGRAVGDIGVTGGRIVAMGALESTTAERILNARGLHVLPGVIDTQVHFREPGLEHKEDLHTGSRAAVKGGVTAVFEMPNTKPLTIHADLLEDKVIRAKGRMFCDFAFFIGGSAENVRALPQLERLEGCSGVKIFMGSSTGSLLAEDDETVREILAHGVRRVAVHSEDEMMLRSRKGEIRDGDPSSHPVWRDVETAVSSTRRLVSLARETGRRIHLLHVSTAEEMDLVEPHKDLVTIEVTPQHLTLAGPEAYERYGTKAQMNPPIRDARAQGALWRALDQGLVDVLGSDHAPHTEDEKARPYPQSPSGLPGVQTLVPLMLDHVAHGRLTLERFVDLTSAGPKRIFGIAGKGRIAIGYDADFTIVDLGAEREITRDWLESRAGWSTFEGWRVRGWPVGTIVRGRLAMWEGEIQGEPCGAPVRFEETVAPLKE